MRSISRLVLSCLALTLLSSALNADEKPALCRTTRSGAWSEAATWEGGKLPTAGSKVQVRTGHTIIYDVKSAQAIRSLHIAGTLSFATEKDTRLEVGLIRIQAGDSTDEEGFDCTAHVAPVKSGETRPALLVGTPEQPIAAGHTALIRLVYF